MYKEFNSLEQSIPYFMSFISFRKWMDRLSSHEKSAIDTYTKGESYCINSHMRNKLPFSIKKRVYKRVIRHIDTAISKFELEEPILIHRWLDRFPSKEFDMLKLLTESGEIYIEPGYSSCTLTSDSIGELDWFKRDIKHKIHLIIKVPKGFGIGAYVQVFTEEQSKYQNEFLLARKTKFHIPNISLEIKPLVEIPVEVIADE